MRFEFLTPLVTKHLRPGWAMVTQPLVVYSERLGGTHVVPAGFEFDWDSVPRIPGVHALLKGRAEKAACVHDHLYRDQVGPRGAITRAVADKVMLDAMKAEGVSWRHRWLIYAGVRAGGWPAWRRHQ